MPTSGTYLFACRLRRLVAPSALGSEGPFAESGTWRRDVRRRKVGFLSCLLKRRDPIITYDLRMVSHPNPAQPSAGRILFGLLVREDGASDQLGLQHAHETLRLLESFLHEVEWELLDAGSAL